LLEKTSTNYLVRAREPYWGGGGGRDLTQTEEEGKGGKNGLP